jgi:tetratricopeptide (TPR) repeat protein
MPEAFLEGQKGFRPRRLQMAWAHQLRGDEAAAREAFASVLPLLDSLVAIAPEDWDLHAARGLAAAGLGLREAALGEARWLQQSSFYREDQYEGTIAALERARVLAQIGDADAALDEIEDLLSRPSWFSHHTLRLDPLFDPIRHDPRFQALLVKYANPEGGG